MDISSIAGTFTQAINTQQAGNLQNPAQIAGVINAPQENERLAFETLLDAYMGMVGAAGRTEMHAQQLSVDFALGNHDDMLSVILAQEMAYVSMHFAVQVTSRIIEAYREIMRMQI